MQSFAFLCVPLRLCVEMFAANVNLIPPSLLCCSVQEGTYLVAAASAAVSKFESDLPKPKAQTLECQFGFEEAKSHLNLPATRIDKDSVPGVVKRGNGQAT